MQTARQKPDYKRIRILLEEKYHTYNYPRFIAPDPLVLVREYGNLKDRELCAFLASQFALGRACCITDTVHKILNNLCMTHQPSLRQSPFSALLAIDKAELELRFSNFVYRFFASQDLIALLLALQNMYSKYGSLEALMAECLNKTNQNLIPALACFVRTLEQANPLPVLWKPNLVASPEHGSACKRLMLFLRWMVRTDAVDPGGWTVLSPKDLLAPLDTHAIRSYRQLGFITTSAVNIRTVLTVTEHLRHIAPEDPLKYDFVLSRPYASCEDII